jgi:YegS/Rv2252/BmrU family lipid kinase
MSNDARLRSSGTYRTSFAAFGTNAAPGADLARATFTVLVNPRAGGGGADNLLTDVARKCEALGLRAQVHGVGPDADLRAQVHEAVRSGSDVVVAGGGDGTVSAVASCLAGTGTALGVLPLGTLNHFAKDLAIPTDLDEALGVLVGGTISQVDVADVNGRVFVNNSSIGLYPQIVRHRDLQQRRLGRSKWRALVAACWHALATNQPATITLEVDGESMRRRTGFVFIGNNAYCIDGLRVGERTSLRGGRLSLYVTKKADLVSMLSLAWRALTQQLRDADDFEALQAGTVTVRTRRRRVHVAIDGEVQLMDAPLHYRIRPAALRVIVPAEQPSSGRDEKKPASA